MYGRIHAQGKHVTPALRTVQGLRRTEDTRSPPEARPPRRHNRRQYRQTFSLRITTFLLAHQAALTKTGKGQLAAIYIATAASGSGAAKSLRRLHPRQIQYRAAASTNKVDMGCGNSVESLHSVYGSQARNQALLLKQRQIPVHRSQRQVRIFRLQLGKNAFR